MIRANPRKIRYPQRNGHLLTPRNEFWLDHHGKTVYIDGYAHTLSVNTYRQTYPYEAVAIDVVAIPKSKSTRYYQEIKRKLRDDWVTDVLESDIKVQSEILRQLGVTANPREKKEWYSFEVHVPGKVPQYIGTALTTPSEIKKLMPKSTILPGRIVKVWGRPPDRNPILPKPSIPPNRRICVRRNTDSDPPRIALLRDIVKRRQYGNVEGQMVDTFSASVAVQIYDALSPENKAKLVALPIGKFFKVVWKLAGENPEEQKLRERKNPCCYLNIRLPGPLFPLGEIIATKGALRVLDDSGEDPLKFLRRHASGDWGDLDRMDKIANEMALERGGRIMSSYKTQKGKEIWIITEADRSITTILLPEEY